jgi:DNA-binding NarL/FixJ family response regulator
VVTADSLGVTPIRVIVADDDESVRIWLRAVIGMAEGLDLAGEAVDAASAVELARTVQPDVAIVDVQMPRGGGPEGTQLMRLFSSDTRIIAHSGHDSPAHVVAMIEAGANGYVVKQGDADEIITAVRTVAAGGVHLSRGVERIVVDQVRDGLAIGGKQALQRHEGISRH